MSGDLGGALIGLPTVGGSLGGVGEPPYKGSGIFLTVVGRAFEGDGAETIPGPGAPTPTPFELEPEPVVSVDLGGALGDVGL